MFGQGCRIQGPCFRCSQQKVSWYESVIREEGGGALDLHEMIVETTLCNAGHTVPEAEGVENSGHWKRIQ